MREFAEYLLEFASTGWGPVVMVTHAFLESFILPLAHELFLIPVALARPHLSFVFALMSTTASVLGISVGYLIGRRGGRAIAMRIIQPRILIMAKRKIHQYDVWAVAIACFTPIPVKVFALVAGITRINYKKMVLVAFISRGARYFLVSALLFFYGEPIRAWILYYMDWLMIAALTVVIISVFAWKHVEKFLLHKSRVPSSAV